MLFFSIKSKIKGYMDRYIINLMNARSQNIEYQLQLAALQSTVKYVQIHMKNTRGFKNKYELLAEALRQSRDEGLFFEFGVYKGETIRFIANIKNATRIHGFDSFEGLPEFWRDGFNAGDLSLYGALPEVPQNVLLHKGWFNETLPLILKDSTEDVSFLHIDCDLYSSTRTIFELLGKRIKTGTIIAFDEYFNYPFWEEHEHRAFQEFVHEKGLNYQYIGFNKYCEQVAVKIL